MNVILQLRTGFLEKRDSSHWGVINVRDEEQSVEDIADFARSIDGAVTHPIISMRLNCMLQIDMQSPIREMQQR